MRLEDAVAVKLLVVDDLKGLLQDLVKQGVPGILSADGLVSFVLLRAGVVIYVVLCLVTDHVIVFLGVTLRHEYLLSESFFLGLRLGLFFGVELHGQTRLLGVVADVVRIEVLQVVRA